MIVKHTDDLEVYYCLNYVNTRMIEMYARVKY